MAKTCCIKGVSPSRRLPRSFFTNFAFGLLIAFCFCEASVSLLVPEHSVRKPYLPHHQRIRSEGGKHPEGVDKGRDHEQPPDEPSLVRIIVSYRRHVLDRQSLTRPKPLSSSANPSGIPPLISPCMSLQSSPKLLKSALMGAAMYPVKMVST